MSAEFKKNADQDLADALKKCESEAIHLTHAIQPQGYLLAIDECAHIRLASYNLAQLTGTSADAALGQTLAQLFGDSASQALQREFASLPAAQSATLRLHLATCSTQCTANARIHRADGLIVIELERELEREDGRSPFPPASANLSDSTRHSLIRETLQRLEMENEVVDSCRWITQCIRQLTGFDRVMIYRFSENWDGEVIAESGSGALAKMIGHHFPAADIPAQARALYAKNLIRVLSDTEAMPVPLIPAANPLTGQPLDMSDSVLRTISPIHVHYLRNMGVGASLSVSLMQGGRLWGLIACHHVTPRNVPFPVRDAAEIIGRMASFKLDSLENRRAQSWLARLHDTQLKLTDVIRSAQSVAALSAVLQAYVLPLIDASACLLVIDAQNFPVGDLPQTDLLTAFVNWLRETHAQQTTFTTDFLTRDFPQAAAFQKEEGYENLAVAAGITAISLGSGWKDYLICCRPEIVRDIVWAGNPTKHIRRDASGVQLDPRHSFASWVETSRGRSLPWDRLAIDALTAVSHSLQTVIAEKSLQSVAQRINRLKDEFVTNISHEMRTPLHAILSFASIGLQRLQGPPEKLGNYLTRIQASGQRLHALVEDLLILTRLQAGMIPINARHTNVRSILETCVANFAARETEKGLQVEIQLNTERFDACVAPELIAKVIDKLLSNAGKFSPAAGRIHARLTDQTRPINALCLEIIDEGPGIPADELESVFDKFAQSTRTQTGAGGTGLGLSICREIMNLHGGSIHAENRVTGGTRLVCRIPRDPQKILGAA